MPPYNEAHKNNPQNERKQRRWNTDAKKDTCLVRVSGGRELGVKEAGWGWLRVGGGDGGRQGVGRGFT